MLEAAVRRRIEASYYAMQMDGPDFGSAFYGQLFRIRPDMRDLFPTNLFHQSRKLSDMLSVVVATSHDLESLVPLLRDMGRRHVAYGATEAHYDAVGSALLAALAEHCPGWSGADREAWAELYSFASSTMIEAAREVV